ncbi:DUF4190 domain-containing protein [Demequina capsici]|uniref:DUF4190 domain-containing protein n=1 Tax=Demequina capsici TaxID=3075620 RepID=A0AA96JA82_9MICO|nr:DUF4190 domain-containing protein [Demequina sp. PMTSA13]WNM27165.1 DUF4190 domain-containing protein [Demequina sp. PMTSA13]
MSEQPTTRTSSDPFGIGAVIAGVLLLSPVAIVLGHLGLRRSRTGTRRARTAAVAGTILGYVGLAVTVAAVAVYVTSIGPDVSRQTADAQAQADITAVANTVADGMQTDPALPDVQAVDGAYMVGDTQVDALLGGSRTLELTGTSRTDWCLDLTYEGGDLSEVSYVGTDGFHVGACS